MLISIVNTRGVILPGAQATVMDLRDPKARPQPILWDPDLAAEEAEQYQPGAIVAGKYRLGKILGQGRFGTVWLAVKLDEDPLDGSYDRLWGHAQTTQGDSPAGTASPVMPSQARCAS